MRENLGEPDRLKALERRASTAPKAAGCLGGVSQACRRTLRRQSPPLQPLAIAQAQEAALRFRHRLRAIVPPLLCLPCKGVQGGGCLPTFQSPCPLAGHL